MCAVPFVLCRKTQHDWNVDDQHARTAGESRDDACGWAMSEPPHQKLSHPPQSNGISVDKQTRLQPQATTFV